jgi:hypothetical protein
MKCAARIAFGVAGGYFLGRTKKMKLALTLAGMAAGRETGGPGALLGQGKKILGASPELSRLTDEVRGRLLEAGKGAALAVAARQVESLTERVAGRVEDSLGNLAERGRPSKNSSRADDDVADEDIDDAAGDDAAGDDAAGDDAAGDDADDDERDEAGSGSEDSRTNAAPVRARRSEGAAGASMSGTRTAVRRSAGAGAGARRTAEKAAGRPARARGRNDNG